MVRLLESRGGELPASGWPLPQGVLGTIQQRLQALPAQVMQLVAAAAVAGREFDLGLLAGALDLPPAALHEQLPAALEYDILRLVPDRPGRVRFAHADQREERRAIIDEIVALTGGQGACRRSTLVPRLLPRNAGARLCRASGDVDAGAQRGLAANGRRSSPTAVDAGATIVFKVTGVFMARQGCSIGSASLVSFKATPERPRRSASLNRKCSL